MRPISCRLRYRSISEHLQQLYTGFLLLHRSGLIRLTQEFRPEPFEYNNDAPHLKLAAHAHLDAWVEGLRLHFDTHDSMELAVPELDRCDFYFKRSYSPGIVSALSTSQQRKVLPLGLNYHVLPDTMDSFAVRRALRLHGMSRAGWAPLRQALCIGQSYHALRLARMESMPDLTLPARVLFLAAAYDPHDNPERSPDKIHERRLINETRAGVIRALRDTLGDAFTGGFCDSPYARRHYPELIAPASQTPRGCYLAIMKSHAICVSTTGLHGSIGWKLAEYVACARAPLSETLNYTVPAGFAAGRNYLEFTSPQECVAAAVRLIDDSALRHELMRNNARYYAQSLRPDALVRRALYAAVGFPSIAEPILA